MYKGDVAGLVQGVANGAVLVLVPVRLGGERLNPVYVEGMKVRLWGFFLGGGLSPQGGLLSTRRGAEGTSSVSGARGGVGSPNPSGHPE